MGSAADNKAPYSVFKKFVDSYAALEDFVKDYESYLEQSTAETKGEIDDAISQAELVFYIGLLVALIISMALSQVIAKAINQGIQNLKHTAQKLAGGDLVTKAVITSNDELKELGDAINQTIDRLHETIATINESSLTVVQNSNEVIHYNEDVKHNSDEIADNTNQAVTAIEEMSTTSQSIASNITQTAASAEEIDKVALESLDASEQSVNEIETLLASFTTTVATVDDLKSQTDRREVLS